MDNIDNESKMKYLGEEKVLKEIEYNGKSKKVISSQIGQQMIFSEAARLEPIIKDWINNHLGTRVRLQYIEYFIKQDNKMFLIQKISEVLLLLISSQLIKNKKKYNKCRYKNISTVKRYVFNDMDEQFVWRILEVIVDESKYLESKLEKEFSNISKKLRSRIYYDCNIDNKIIEKINILTVNAFYSLPMTTKPIDWQYNENGEVIGGYESSVNTIIKKSKLLVNSNIMESINYIQSTPWTIYSSMVNVVERDLELPTNTNIEFINAPKLIDFKTDLDYHKANDDYKNKLAMLSFKKKKYKSDLGKYNNKKLAINIAKKYFNETIFFPHNLCFRGRVYPLPVILSPQGSDEVKSMLMYKHGEIIDDRGLEWAWAYLSSLYGLDKLDFNERVKKGKYLIDSNYLEADEPYQFLSHQKELKKVIANRLYKFRGRVHLDACNSGSQFTALLTGDINAALATNVIPTYDSNGKQVRQDIYMLVANKALLLAKKELSTCSEEDIEAITVIIELLEKDGRKICKVPTMVSQYSGSISGRKDLMLDYMLEHEVDLKIANNKTANIFGRIVGDSINGVLVGGKAFETYIKKMNSIIAKQEVPVKWTTGDGFVVNHVRNKTTKIGKFFIDLPNSRRKSKIVLNKYSDNNDVFRMSNAISPNFVHSLDAELLRRVSIKMKDSGIHNSDWIHDSFGCHPNNVDKMLEITKIEFFDMMSGDVLGRLHEELMSQIKDTKKNRRLLKKVIYPRISNIDFSENFVEKSDWFFS